MFHDLNEEESDVCAKHPSVKNKADTSDVGRKASISPPSSMARAIATLGKSDLWPPLAVSTPCTTEHRRPALHVAVSSNYVQLPLLGSSSSALFNGALLMDEEGRRSENEKEYENKDITCPAKSTSSLTCVRRNTATSAELENGSATTTTPLTTSIASGKRAPLGNLSANTSSSIQTVADRGIHLKGLTKQTSSASSVCMPSTLSSANSGSNLNRKIGGISAVVPPPPPPHIITANVNSQLTLQQQKTLSPSALASKTSLLEPVTTEHLRGALTSQDMVGTLAPDAPAPPPPRPVHMTAPRYSSSSSRSSSPMAFTSGVVVVVGESDSNESKCKRHDHGGVDEGRALSTAEKECRSPTDGDFINRNDDFAGKDSVQRASRHCGDEQIEFNLSPARHLSSPASTAVPFAGTPRPDAPNPRQARVTTTTTTSSNDTHSKKAMHRFLFVKNYIVQPKTPTSVDRRLQRLLNEKNEEERRHTKQQRHDKDGVAGEQKSQLQPAVAAMPTKTTSRHSGGNESSLACEISAPLALTSTLLESGWVADSEISGGKKSERAAFQNARGRIFGLVGPPIPSEVAEAVVPGGGGRLRPISPPTMRPHTSAMYVASALPSADTKLLSPISGARSNAAQKKMPIGGGVGGSSCLRRARKSHSFSLRSSAKKSAATPQSSIGRRRGHHRRSTVCSPPPFLLEEEEGCRSSSPSVSSSSPAHAKPTARRISEFDSLCCHSNPSSLSSPSSSSSCSSSPSPCGVRNDREKRNIDSSNCCSGRGGDPLRLVREAAEGELMRRSGEYEEEEEEEKLLSPSMLDTTALPITTSIPREDFFPLTPPSPVRCGEKEGSRGRRPTAWQRHPINEPKSTINDNTRFRDNNEHKEEEEEDYRAESPTSLIHLFGKPCSVPTRARSTEASSSTVGFTKKDQPTRDRNNPNNYSDESSGDDSSDDGHEEIKHSVGGGSAPPLPPHPVAVVVVRSLMPDIIQSCAEEERYTHPKLAVVNEDGDGSKEEKECSPLNPRSGNDVSALLVLPGEREEQVSGMMERAMMGIFVSSTTTDCGPPKPTEMAALKSLAPPCLPPPLPLPLPFVPSSATSSTLLELMPVLVSEAPLERPANRRGKRIPTTCGGAAGGSSLNSGTESATVSAEPRSMSGEANDLAARYSNDKSEANRRRGSDTSSDADGFLDHHLDHSISTTCSGGLLAASGDPQVFAAHDFSSPSQCLSSIEGGGASSVRSLRVGGGEGTCTSTSFLDQPDIMQLNNDGKGLTTVKEQMISSPLPTSLSAAKNERISLSVAVVDEDNDDDFIYQQLLNLNSGGHRNVPPIANKDTGVESGRGRAIATTRAPSPAVPIPALALRDDEDSPSLSLCSEKKKDQKKKEKTIKSSSSAAHDVVSGWELDDHGPEPPRTCESNTCTRSERQQQSPPLLGNDGEGREKKRKDKKKKESSEDEMKVKRKKSTSSKSRSPHPEEGALISSRSTTTKKVALCGTLCVPKTPPPPIRPSNPSPLRGMMDRNGAMSDGKELEEEEVRRASSRRFSRLSPPLAQHSAPAVCTSTASPLRSQAVSGGSLSFKGKRESDAQRLPPIHTSTEIKSKVCLQLISTSASLPRSTSSLSFVSASAARSIVGRTPTNSIGNTPPIPSSQTQTAPNTCGGGVRVDLGHHNGPRATKEEVPSILGRKGSSLLTLHSAPDETGFLASASSQTLVNSTCISQKVRPIVLGTRRRSYHPSPSCLAKKDGGAEEAHVVATVAAAATAKGGCSSTPISSLEVSKDDRKGEKACRGVPAAADSFAHAHAHCARELFTEWQDTSQTVHQHFLLSLSTAGELDHEHTLQVIENLLEAAHSKLFEQRVLATLALCSQVLNNKCERLSLEMAARHQRAQIEMQRDLFLHHCVETFMLVAKLVEHDDREEDEEKSLWTRLVASEADQRRAKRERDCRRNARLYLQYEDGGVSTTSGHGGPTGAGSFITPVKKEENRNAITSNVCVGKVNQQPAVAFGCAPFLPLGLTCLYNLAKEQWVIPKNRIKMSQRQSETLATLSRLGEAALEEFNYSEL